MEADEHQGRTDDQTCPTCGEQAIGPCEACDEDVCCVCAGELHRDCASDVEVHARTFALENVALTGPLLRYDPVQRFAPTPEDYEIGLRDAHTENSVRAANRHRATNYDELLAGSEKTSPIHRIYYLAIRERVEELLEDAEFEASISEPEGE